MRQTTIGQRLLAAVIAHQMGISMDRALKVYVVRHEIDPSLEKLGERLLHHCVGSVAGKR